MSYIKRPIFKEGEELDGAVFEGEAASKFAMGYVGKPVRYCNKDSGVADMAGVAQEHACDITQDMASVVGTIKSVYRESDGVWYADAEIKDGVNPEALPTGWSVFAKADTTTATYIPQSVALTNNPKFKMSKKGVIAASDTLNINNPKNNVKGDNMADDIKEPVKVEEKTVADPTPVSQERGLKPEDVEKIIEARRSEIEAQAATKVREQLKKEMLAEDITEKLISTGTITAADKESKIKELLEISTNGLETMRTAFDKVTTKQVKHEKPFKEDVKVESTTGKRELTENEKVVCKMLNIPHDVWLKHNPSTDYARVAEYRIQSPTNHI